MTSVAPTQRSLRVTVATLLALAAATGSHAEPVADDKTTDQVSLGTVGAQGGAALSVEVTASRYSVAAVAPVQANLSATEPQSVISRAFIEDMVPTTGNFNSIIGMAPSMATTPSANGPGLSDTSTTMRGFKDNQYNVTWDGIPFGDSNDPSHHSTSYFPSSVIGGVIIERGPGNASNFGQATFGGSVNLVSKTPSATGSTEIIESRGNWGTNLFGIAYESGKIERFNDSTLQLNYQKLQTNGYLAYNDLSSDDLLGKFQTRIFDTTTLTVLATYNDEFLHLTDNWVGPTGASAGAPSANQLALYGIGYGGMNNDPHSMAFYGYNHIRKTTDMEYIRAQTDWGNGWQTDNNLYTYAYKNYTVAGDSPDQAGLDPFCAATQTNLETEVCSGHKGSPAGDVPGNDKLNEYRTQGDIFKATYQTDIGLLRTGFWAEVSHTHRHKFYLDLTTNTFTGKVKNDQGSSWTNYQPFAEFEWAAATGLTVTPGVKYLDFTRTVDALNNNGYGPFRGDYKYTKVLPFLTINQRFGEHDSAYFQYAQGLQIPTLDYTYVSGATNAPTPQTTTNYQLGFVHKDNRLTWDVDIYRINFNNLILNIPSTGNATVFINSGGAVYQGLEGELAYLIGGGFSVFVNGSLNSAKFTNINDTLVQEDYNNNGVSGAYTYNNGNPITNGRIPYAPDSTLAGGLLYKSGPVDASLGYSRTGKQYAVPGEVQAYLIPAFDNIDLNGTYTFKNVGGFSSVKLGLSVYNIANKRNLTLITQGPDEYNYQAPRSVMATVKVKF